MTIPRLFALLFTAVGLIAESYTPSQLPLTTNSTSTDRLVIWQGGAMKQVAPTLVGPTGGTAGRAVLASETSSAARSALGLVIGTDVQSHSGDLDVISALPTVSFGRSLLTSNSLPYQPINGDLTAISSSGTGAAGRAVLALSTTNGILSYIAGQPLDGDLTAIAAINTTAFGRSYLAVGDASAGRTLISAQPLNSELTAIGALSTASFGRSLLTSNSFDFQPLNAELTAIGALSTTSYGRSLLTQSSASTARTYLGTIIGTDVQAYDADLTTWSGITPGTGIGTALAATPTGSGSVVLATAPTLAGVTITGNIDTTGSAGPLYVNPTTFKVGFGGAASQPFEFYANLMRFGANDGNSTNRLRTANTDQDIAFTAPDYAATTAVGFLRMSPTVSANTLLLGAGQGGFKGATSVRFATAASATATTTTTHGNINASGQWVIGGISPTGTAKLTVASSTGGIVPPSNSTATWGGFSMSTGEFGYDSTVNRLILYDGTGRRNLATTTDLTSYQPINSELTAIAALSTASFGRSLLTQASASATRTYIGTVIGTDVQAYDADLTTWAGITPGTGIAAALGSNVGSAGSPVVNGGALGTPSSATLTSATGLPISTGVSGLGTGLGTALGLTPTGSGVIVLATNATLVTPTLGVASATSLAVASAASAGSVVSFGSITAGGNITGLNLSGNNTGDQTSVSGNAGTATTLATGRTIGITGDLSWTSPSFNGSANVTAAATLASSGVAAGAYGNGSYIPTITVDAKGRVTSVTTNAVSGGGGSGGGNVYTASTSTNGYMPMFSGATGTNLVQSFLFAETGVGLHVGTGTYGTGDGGNLYFGAGFGISLNLYNTARTFSVGFQAPTGLAADKTITVPATTGTLMVSDPTTGIAPAALTVGGGTFINAIRHGVATLAAGTVTVSQSSVTANTRIMLTSQGGGTTPGILRVNTRSAGNFFTITSSIATDTDDIAWTMIEP
jgi:hypothetical protein